MSETPKLAERPVSAPAADLLAALSADALSMLESVDFPAYVVDLDRRLCWQNPASIALVGDLRGRLDSSLLDGEDLARAREAFARKQNGAPHTELEVSVTGPDGTRLRLKISSVPLKNADGAMIGSFGIVQVLERLESPLEAAPPLRPRERETLTLLAAGCSTVQMAEQMGISTETVRNYVRGVLRGLGARSRVEAVAKGRQARLI